MLITFSFVNRIHLIFQNVFREAGCLVLLAKLINHNNYFVKEAAITTLSNMALNRDNQKELKVSIKL